LKNTTVKNAKLHSNEEYLLRIREKVDSLKARLRLPAYSAARQKQQEIRVYFTRRAVQLGEAAFRIGDLEIPQFVLARVLCEDFILLFWVSLSPKNATQFDKTGLSAMSKLVRVNVTRGRALLRSTITGKNESESLLPKLDRFKLSRNLEEIAKDLGLSKLYDVTYRFDSLHVHANMFGLGRENEQEGTAVALSAINATLKVIVLLADRSAGSVTADEVLTSLGLHTLAGQ